MKLYLVRHGEALSSNLDPDRSLSQRGRQGVEKTAVFLSGMGVAVAKIFHSEKKRALQTAEIIAAGLKSTAQQMKGLAPNDPVERWIDELENTNHDLMLVGHLPFLPALARALVGGEGKGANLSLPVSGVVALERDAKGRWSLVGSYRPDLI